MKVIAAIIMLFTAIIALVNGVSGDAQVVIIEPVVNKMAVQLADHDNPKNVDEILFREFSKGDSWLFNVKLVHDNYSLEVRIEDTAYKGDSTYYIASYWPSKRFAGSKYRLSEFGGSAPEGSLNKNGKTVYEDGEIFGIMSIVEKESNRVLCRQLFTKDEKDANIILTEKFMGGDYPSGQKKPIRSYYAYSRQLGPPESILPLLNIPFGNMRDTCIGTLKPYLPPPEGGYRIKSKSDTSKHCFARYWQNDTLLVEVKSRTYYAREFGVIHRMYFTKDSKWWVKYESIKTASENYVDRSMGMHRPGMAMEVTLLEERLSNTRR